ncbi:uncharacterized mitochondrial protein AtMg00810-like [Solanum dulcamara]|uniref:uncharacterized mitochondrial protein AtMg00810-like n=1 Tax=Solanum dulcamara TaxID=45834 RepID=UPI0024863856|nr:uncharacterized mitochondrial protein AtMg00810-like [Solanum dulcamara]
MVTVRSIVAVSAVKHWPIFQRDVHNAFLQSDLLKEVYLEVSAGFASQRGKHVICKLHKFLYDDLLITESNTDLILQTKNDLKLKFKMKDLGVLEFFLGIEFARSEKGIVMSQSKYALELISDLGLSGTKPFSTPLETNLKLTSTEYDAFLNDVKRESPKSEYMPLTNPTQYQRLVEKLLYLTMTRINIAYVVQVLSQFMHNPKQSHRDAALRVVKYIKQAPGLALLMPSDGSRKLKAYCDSDWGGCLQNRRSVTRYLVKFGNVVVSWKSKKQETVARSFAEAEFKSMASVVA